MDWTSIKAAIRLAVSDILGCPLADVAWKNTPEAGSVRGMVSSFWVDLALKSPQSVGVDDQRRTYNAGTDTLSTKVSGPRLFTVTAKIEAETQAPGEETVGVRSGRLRTLLQSKGIQDRLRAVGVSLAEMPPTIEADYLADDRMVSGAITDILFNAAENLADPFASPDYIHTVAISTEPTSEVEADFSVTTQPLP